MGIMKEISVKALAKINLGLDVVRRREDGYHAATIRHTAITPVK